jgi:hypothetical protein
MNPLLPVGYQAVPTTVPKLLIPRAVALWVPLRVKCVKVHEVGPFWANAIGAADNQMTISMTTHQWRRGWKN